MSMTDVQRLYAEWIARGEESLAVGHEEREHSVELLLTISAHVLEQVQHTFGIAVGSKAMPPQAISKLSVIVDFTIPNQRKTVVLAAHRLPTALEIDNRKASMKQRSA